jgi:hypothetical protein
MNPVHNDQETSGPMVEIRTFNLLTRSFCTTSSKPVTSALATGVQFPNAFSDPNTLNTLDQALNQINDKSLKS